MLSYFFLISYILYLMFSIRIFMLTSGYRPAMNGAYNRLAGVCGGSIGATLSTNPSFIYFIIVLIINALIWLYAIAFTTEIIIYSDNITFDVEHWKNEYSKKEKLEVDAFRIKEINKRKKHFRVCVEDMEKETRNKMIKEINYTYGVSIEKIPRIKFISLVARLICGSAIFLLMYFVVYQKM